MPKIVFRFLETGETRTVNADAGTSVLDAALKNGLEIEHACEKACACTTCHVYVTDGLRSLQEASEAEEDMLDKAWALNHNSRLSCQIMVANKDLTIEVPRYTINHASERH